MGIIIRAEDHIIILALNQFNISTIILYVEPILHICAKFHTRSIVSGGSIIQVRHLDLCLVVPQIAAFQIAINVTVTAGVLLSVIGSGGTIPFRKRDDSRRLS